MTDPTCHRRIPPFPLNVNGPPGTPPRLDRRKAYGSLSPDLGGADLSPQANRFAGIQTDQLGLIQPVPLESLLSANLAVVGQVLKCRAKVYARSCSQYDDEAGFQLIERKLPGRVGPLDQLDSHVTARVADKQNSSAGLRPGGR